MDDRDHKTAAAHLLRGYADHSPVAPIIELFPDATVGDAYMIQRHQIGSWVNSGDRVLGHKVGLASKAMQRQANVDQPDYGHLMQSMFLLEHEVIPEERFIQPRIEPEIAFVLSGRLEGPGVTVADAIRAIDFVLPALEIIDSRIFDWNLSIVDTIADNASSGAVILGSTPVSPRSVNLKLTGCTLHRNGEVIATGAGGAVLGSPINSLVWLANTVGPLGIALEPGHVVLPGSMTRAPTFHPGDAMVANIAGLGMVTAVLGRPAEATS